MTMPGAAWNLKEVKMTKIHLTGVAVATLFSATLAAQAQSPAAGAAQPSPGSADRVTVTGCIERADQMTSAGSAVGTSVDSLDFVLIKAPESPAASAANAATPADRPGAVGTSGTAAPPMYRLQSDTEKLNPHVGHKVEVIGTRDATAGSSAPSATAASPSAANAPRLHVESVKMLAESCGR
jgi:hypothetical protein